MKGIIIALLVLAPVQCKHKQGYDKTMKGIIIALLVLALYGCIACAAVWFGYKAAVLMGIALIVMGVLEGIV